MERQTTNSLFSNKFTIIGHNPVLYNRLVSRLADVVRERTSASRKAEVGGVVINSCGWVRGEGYNQIKHIAQVKIKIIPITISYFKRIINM